MNIYILFALCFLPVIALFVLLAFLPKQRPIFRYLLSCALGVLTILPSSAIQFFVLKIPAFSSNSFISILITSIIFNGLIEESFKMGFMLLIPRKDFSILTYFFCALLLGTAAGSLETAIYLMNSLQKIALISGTETAMKMIFSRMFSAQAIHAFCAGLSGIFIWGCKKEIRHLIIFIQTIVLHGLYNFFIAFSSEFRWFAVCAILFTAIECRVWYKTVKNSEIQQDFPQNDEEKQVFFEKK